MEAKNKWKEKNELKIQWKWGYFVLSSLNDLSRYSVVVILDGIFIQLFFAFCQQRFGYYLASIKTFPKSHALHWLCVLMPCICSYPWVIAPCISSPLCTLCVHVIYICVIICFKRSCHCKASISVPNVATSFKCFFVHFNLGKLSLSNKLKKLLVQVPMICEIISNFAHECLDDECGMQITPTS